MRTVEDVRFILSVIRYHNKCKLKNDSTYNGSSLHNDTKESIALLEQELKSFK